MIPEPIISLDDPAARDAAAVGEKAAALARMRQAGLPVPAGFVVDAAAFDEATAAVAPRIESQLSAAADGMQALTEASRTLRELVAGLRPPPGLSEAVAAAYKRLVDGAAVAVRSSGTAEDLPDASFAGQYDSYLNVSGAASVVQRMLDVWASLYSLQAIAYRQQQGVPHSAARMAVLVQQQLAADASGVLFTLDPVSGARDRLLINASFGLGEGVVSGETPSDTFSLDAESLAVVERGVAEKTTMVAMQHGGGITQQRVPEARRREPSLSDERLADLGRLARSVREIEGGHRDIEFAVVDGEVQLLQARPVTGLEAGDASEGDAFPVDWEDAADEGYAWTLSVSFTDPTPLRRFEEELARATAEHGQRVFDDTGVPMARSHILRVINGYGYVRGPEVSDEAVRERRQQHLALGRTYDDRGTTYFDEVIEPEVLGLLEELGPFRRRAEESLSDRFAFLERALEVYGHVNCDLHWRQITRDLDAPEWPEVFHDLTGLPAIDSGVLLQALENKTTRMVRRLCGLARIVQEDPDLSAVFDARAFEQLRKQPLRSRPATQRFRRRFNAMLRDIGRRNGRSFGSQTSFLTPTWNLAPSVPLDLIARYAGQDLDELDRRERSARSERETATRAARNAIGGGETRKRFDVAVAEARLQVRFMEDHNAIMEQGTAGVIREATWWMGEALARRDRLAAPDDAIHLSLDELREAARDEAGGDLRPLVRSRVAEFERRSKLSPPRRLGRRRARATPPSAQRDAAASTAGVDGQILRGEAASRGRYTGRARVFRPGGDPPEIERGDILVARNAGQDWTPILPLLGGIVLDEGAVFQHAALIAREYRVPCVLQTREATTAIADGQRITIDGDRGLVELAPDAGA